MIFKNLNNKQILQLTIIGMMILLALTYVRSLKSTISICKQYFVAKQRTEHTGDANKEVSFLQGKSKELDLIIGKQTEAPELVQNKLIKFLVDHNDITISSIEKLHISKDKYYKIYSNTITLKGNYQSLSRTIYEFETKFRFARIANVEFYLTKNRELKKDELLAKIIFQNYEKNI